NADRCAARCQCRGGPGLARHVGYQYRTMFWHPESSRCTTRAHIPALGTRPFTLGLMLEIADMYSFPNLRDQEDAERHLRRAREAVAEPGKWTAKHQDLATEKARLEEQRVRDAAQAATTRAVAQRLGQLKAQFFALHASDNAQQRGRDLELLLNELFMACDLLPRIAFALWGGQIDGAFAHETDNYIIEAKRYKGPVENMEVSVFSEKVRRKGKNALLSVHQRERVHRWRTRRLCYGNTVHRDRRRASFGRSG